MLFSIITASFNSAKTIRRTMDSILAQSCQDYEYIVVDGGSTDGTVEILCEYERKFAGRMHWISESDNGIYDAMNKGISSAHGEFVHFLQSDDYYFTDALANVKLWMENHPGHAVYYGIIHAFAEDGTLSEIFRVDHRKLPFDNPNHQALFVSRGMFEKYGNFDVSYVIIADVKHMLLLYRGGESFCPMDIMVAHFALGGVSGRNSDALLREHYRLRKEFGYVSSDELWWYVIRQKTKYVIMCVLKLFVKCFHCKSGNQS